MDIFLLTEVINAISLSKAITISRLDYRSIGDILRNPHPHITIFDVRLELSQDICEIILAILSPWFKIVTPIEVAPRC